MFWIPKRVVVRRFKASNNTPGSISSHSCWFIYEDYQKNMWVCTQNGLNKYDSITNTFKVFSFPENELGAFIRDKAGNLYVGTYTKGIHFLNPMVK